MSQTISRLYTTHEQAANAMAALANEDYSDIHMVSGATTTGSIDDIVALITKGNVLASDARVYAPRISQGASLVTVHAPFGGAYQATRILDKYNPIYSGISEPVSSVMEWDEATPMSCILQMPVLLDGAAPFSKFWNVPPLSSSSFSLSSLFGLSLLSRPTASLSSSIGMPLLSNNAAPLSALLHFPTLSKGQSAR